MKLATPTTTKAHEISALSQSEGDEFLQRLKFSAYDATLESLEAKKLTVDRISAGMRRDEIARSLEIMLAVEGVTLGVTQRSKVIE